MRQKNYPPNCISCQVVFCVGAGHKKERYLQIYKYSEDIMLTCVVWTKLIENSILIARY